MVGARIVTSPFVFSCEHASAAVPPGVDLGVSAEVLRSHVAWDHGTAVLAERLAAAVRAPAFYGRWTRLYVDLNRFETTHSVIPTNAFGTPVPGNLDVGADERERRFAEEHRPYRTAVGEAVAAAIAAHGACVHLSIHSFTPSLNGDERDFDMGILFDPERRLDVHTAEVLIRGLNLAGLQTYANRPYLGTGDGLTTALRQVHGPDVYAGIEVETSHRVTETVGGVARVATALIGLLPQIVASLGEG